MVFSEVIYFYYLFSLFGVASIQMYGWDSLIPKRMLLLWRGPYVVQATSY